MRRRKPNWRNTAIRPWNYDGAVLTSSKNKSGYCNPERLIVDVYSKGIEIGVGVSFGFSGLISITLFFIRACYTIDLAPIMECSYRINNPFLLLVHARMGFPASYLCYLSVVVRKDHAFRPLSPKITCNVIT